MTVPSTACSYHPDRRAGVTCQRCNRPICPDCMVTASVGFQCPQCAHQGRQQVHTRHTWARQRDPIVTKAIIAVNAAAFVLAALSSGNLFSTGFQPRLDWGLIGFGRTADMALVGVDAGEWYRIVTGGFMHANLLHIGFNMYLLFLLGSMLEPALGRVRFTLLYTVSLLAGSFGVLLLDPLALTVGASGAVFGLMGATVVAQRASGINPWQSGIGGLVLLNLLITFSVPNISIGGHIGGLIGGAVAGVLLVELPSRLPGADRNVAEVVSSALVAVMGAVCVAGSWWAAAQWQDHLFG